MKSYWALELADFRAARAGAENYSDRDWQPTKWQSLARVCRQVLDCAAASGHPIRSALELGCGSATMLIQMALEGVEGEGVDCDSWALSMAKEAAESLRYPALKNLRFRELDFMGSPWMTSPKFDVVMSLGVIEHFDADGQAQVFDLHRNLSARWILLAVPNLDSPLFQAFLRAKQADNRLYEDQHLPFDMTALIGPSKSQILLDEGCHVFLSRCADRRFADSELRDFETVLRDALVMIDARRFDRYPEMDLSSEDIDALSTVEGQIAGHFRKRFGFLRWYLIDRNASD